MSGTLDNVTGVDAGADDGAGAGIHGGARINVVGIGAEGWEGLSDRARSAIHNSDEVIGSARQLATLPHSVPPRRVWPSPLGSLLDEIVERPDGVVCVLASGDPMHYGIGTTLVRRLGPGAVESGRIRIIAQPSAFSMVCARLGWPADEVELVSAVGRPTSMLNRWLQSRRRVVVYVAGTHGAVEIARMLTDQGFGSSAFNVLEQLGSQAERVTLTTAAAWGDHGHDPLTTVAIEVKSDTDATGHSLAPGLPDSAFAHDGMLTKRHIRAGTLASLNPGPGLLLWDIGAGSGSIGIEWLRAEPTARAVAIEVQAERAARIAMNAEMLGVPELRVVIGQVPELLGELTETPDAIFIGGGLSSGVLEAAWDRLAVGGHMVANAVTIGSEQLLLGAQDVHGGELTKLSISHASPLAGGGHTVWRSALPVVQWAARKL